MENLKTIFTKHWVILLVLLLLFVYNYVYVQTMPAQNHQVTLQQAIGYIDNFKDDPEMGATKGGYFSKEIFNSILAQPNCVGIRYYFAKMNDGTPTLVIVGVDGNNRDIENGVIGELVSPCPPFCDLHSQLNR